MANRKQRQSVMQGHIEAENSDRVGTAVLDNHEHNGASAKISIPAPNLRTIRFNIRGTAAYCQNKFSQKARELMISKQEEGSISKKGKKRDKKDFDAAYKGAMYLSSEGWHGIPASSFRSALISACRLVGFKMTLAKMSLFIVAEGTDTGDFTPLVRITKGKPERRDLPTRNATGVIDIRPRPFWAEGWEAFVNIRYDADQFSQGDVANLLHRVGQQVGIGEGRPDSKMSTGIGWGTFEIVNQA